MQSYRSRFFKKVSLVFALLFIYCGITASLRAQSAPVVQPQGNTPQPFVADDYQIGPGDVLAITVTDAPEFTGKFRVNQSGFLVMSSLQAPLQAAGRTPMQLSKDLVQALQDARLYRDPTVNIFVEEYHSKTVAVVGAVAKPGLYPLQRRTTVIEVISEAGLLPTAGNRVTIIPPSANSGDPTSQPASKTVELAKLMQGKDSSLNVVVHDGEVISVATAEVVYVVGAVTKPGGFALQDRTAGVTALQAIALAQGMTPVASAKRGLIIRRNSDGSARENLPVDLSRIMTGRQGDVQLEANDILFVPVSGSKLTLRAMGQAAMTAVNWVTFYGLGYRVAGL